MLTIDVVVLRGSLAQTLDSGATSWPGVFTLLGFLLASIVLLANLPHWALLACVTLAEHAGPF